MHRYWHLHGTEHGTSCRLKFAKAAPQRVLCPWRMMSASWRKRAKSWKDRLYQLKNRRRARNRPVRYDAKRSEHRVPELNRERKKDNTLNMSSMTEEPNITHHHDGNNTEVTPRRRQGDSSSTPCTPSTYTRYLPGQAVQCFQCAETSPELVISFLWTLHSTRRTVISQCPSRLSSTGPDDTVVGHIFSECCCCCCCHCVTAGQISARHSCLLIFLAEGAGTRDPGAGGRYGRRAERYRADVDRTIGLDREMHDDAWVFRRLPPLQRR